LPATGPYPIIPFRTDPIQRHQADFTPVGVPKLSNIMGNQSLRGYSRQQTLTATACSYLDPGALNVAEQPLQPVADELENRLVD
jgi:hypothetical protein